MTTIRLSTRTVDLGLAAVFGAVMVAERTGSGEIATARLPAAAALSVVVAGSLAFRRRGPLAAYLVGTVALAAEALVFPAGPLTPYANLIGLHGVGLYAPPAQARFGPVIALPGILAYFAGTEATPSPAIPAAVVFIWLVVWAFGYGSARRGEEQEAARQRMRRDAVVDERTHMARELHDLVGHTVNLMLVQAGAGRRVLDRDPEKTRELLLSLENTGREALAELDRTLGLLRRDAVGDVTDDLGAQPGLADLPRLAGRMAEVGLTVTLAIDPGALAVSRGVHLSAYRIVQEAVTNAFKHSGGRSAAVTVRQGDGVVVVEVSDDGRGVSDGYLPGRGLLGIAERVAAFGGTVQHGGGEGGGFRLRAELPLRPVLPARAALPAAP